MNEIVTSDDILGKEAVGPNGSILGTVIKLHVNSKNKNIVGITIDMGFLKPDLFMGIDYIREFGIDAVLLNTTPSEKFKGLKVLTAEGGEVGVVKSVITGRKHIKELIVSSKGRLLSKKELRIHASHIARIGGSIVLKKGQDITRDVPK